MNNPGVKFECGNCAGCPYVKKSIERYEMMDEMASKVLDQSFELTPEVAENIFEDLSDNQAVMQIGPDGVKHIESADDMIESLREGSDKFLEYLDSSRAEVQDGVAYLVDHCDGPLKMRATKAGQVVTATVCMSNAELENGETKLESVVVDRRAA